MSATPKLSESKDVFLSSWTSEVIFDGSQGGTTT